MSATAARTRRETCHYRTISNAAESQLNTLAAHWECFESSAVRSGPTFRGVAMRERRAQAPSAVPSAQRARSVPVRVAREVSGRNGRAVSVISGLPLDPAGLEALATRLKKLCGAGGGVKNGAVEIQGEHRDRIVAELQRLGYPARRAGG